MLYTSNRTISSTESNTDDAFRLLARNNFNIEALHNDVQAVKCLDDQISLKKLQETNIDSYLAHHHDMIIFSTINEARKSSESEFKVLQGRWANEEWSKSKQLILEGLGNRTPIWSHLASNTTQTQKVSSSVVLGTDANNRKTKISKLLDMHVDIVNKLATKNSSMSDNGIIPIRPCIEILNGLNALIASDPELYKQDLLQYRMLLEIFMTISEEDQVKPSSAGQYASIHFTDTNIDRSTVEAAYSMKANVSIRMKNYFQRQISEIWQKKFIDFGLTLPSPSITNDHTHNNSKSRMMRALVAHLYRIKVIPHQCGATKGVSAPGDPLVPLWAFMYYCIRAGELRTALIELDMYCNITVDSQRQSVEAMKVVLTSFLRLESGTQQSLDRESVVAAMSHCRALFEQEGRNPQHDPYKLVLLNLLSLGDQDFLMENELVIINVEDFIWVSLWYECLTFQLVSAGILGAGGFGDIVMASTVLYERVLSSGGAEYYDSAGATPFLYANILVACQRYGEAIAYLWQASKSLEAVHLLIVCLHYGLILPHLPLVSNRKANGNGVALSPASLLMGYTSDSFTSVGLADVSVDYLSFINSQHWLNILSNGAKLGIDAELFDAQEFRSKAVVLDTFTNFILSLSRDQVSDVAWPVNDKETKTPKPSSRLWFYFDNTYIKRFLSDAASVKLKKTQDIPGAIFLLELADMLPEALNELCVQLEKVTSVTGNASQASKDIREKWRLLATDFYDRHVRNKSSTLAAQLATRSQSNVIALLEVLLKLSSFFDFYNLKEYEGALVILRDIGLLPNTEVEADLITDKLIDNDLLMNVLDDLYIATAECLRNSIGDVRSKKIKEHFSGVVTDVEVKLKQLISQVNAVNYLSKKLVGRFKRRDTTQVILKINIDIM